MSPIESARELVTTPAATQQGFVEQALKKTQVANEYVAQAYRLRERLQALGGPQEAIDVLDIQEELIAAAGFSDKAINNLPADVRRPALLTILERINEEAGVNWRDEVVFRFLLTRGDSLGGSMRNITGSISTSKFSQAVLNVLCERGVDHQTTHSHSNPDKIQRIAWRDRTLHFDRRSRFIGNNIDVILLRNPGNRRNATLGLNNREDYVACGELKGGIDPAGADEHWKTASTALGRIRGSFPGRVPPALFFVGAAIEDAMAEEIFSQLQSGDLAFAANFNVPEQLSELVTWLTSL